MSADEQTQSGPHRTYKSLPVVVDDQERDEHQTIGVIIDGAFVPIAQHPTGSVEQMKQRWNDLGGVVVDDADDRSVRDLETRVAKVERALIANGVQLDPPAEQHDDAQHE